MLRTKNEFRKYQDIDNSVKTSHYKTSLEVKQIVFLILLFIVLGWVAYKYTFSAIFGIHFKSFQNMLHYYMDSSMPKLKGANQQFEFYLSALVGFIALIVGISTVFRSAHIRLSHPYVGIEQGSARFGKIPEEVKPLIDPPDPHTKPYFYNKNNMIFTQRVGMSLNIRKTRRNDNVLVVGGSGAGKTRFFVIPNLLQAHTSYIITDPKGEISRNTGWFLKKMGYDVRIFDLMDMEYSSRYNPFNYFIHGEEDVLGLINTIVESTNQGQKPSDPFWEKAESLLLSAIMSYIFTELPKGDRTIGTVMDMLREINNMKVLDILFNDLEKRNPNSYAAKLWESFRVVTGSPKTASSIYITATTRLQVWNQARVRALMSEDTVQLDKLGDRPTALFIVVPDSVKTYNFLAAMMYKQLFDALYYKADKVYGNHNDPRFNEGRLPIHVRFMMDEFPNIGRISEFEEILATVRSRNISCSVIIQNVAQLKSMYHDKGQDAWEVIPGNCSSLLYLGGREYGTMEYISKLLGKTTIDTKDESLQKGKDVSHNESVKKQARDLRSSDEVGRIDPQSAMVLIQNSYPFIDKKFDIFQHPNYKYTAYKGQQGKGYSTKERVKEEIRQSLYT